MTPEQRKARIEELMKLGLLREQAEFAVALEAGDIEGDVRIDAELPHDLRDNSDP